MAGSTTGGPGGPSIVLGRKDASATNVVADVLLPPFVKALGTRLGDLTRFAFRTHDERRAKDPRSAVVGVSVVLAGVPAFAAGIYAVYRVMTPVVASSNRDVPTPSRASSSSGVAPTSRSFRTCWAIRPPR